MLSRFQHALGQSTGFPEAQDLLFESLHALRARLIALPMPTLPAGLVEEVKRQCQQATPLDQATCALSLAESSLDILNGIGVPEWEDGYSQYIALVGAMTDSRAKNSALVYLLSLKAMQEEVAQWIDAVNTSIYIVKTQFFPRYRAFRELLLTAELKGLGVDVEKTAYGRLVMPFVHDAAAMRSIQIGFRELLDKAQDLLQPGRTLSAIEGESLSVPAEQLLARARVIMDRYVRLENIEDFVGDLPPNLADLPEDGEEAPVLPDDGGEASVPSEDGGDSGKGRSVWWAVGIGVTTVITVNLLSRKNRRA